MTSMPVIKWSGSKRSQAKKIIEFFPDFKTYYEPFLGGGSILLELKPKKAVCYDINQSLIDFWNVIKKNPKSMCDYYRLEWNKLQDKGYKHYLDIRNRYNNEPNGYDLLFLSRTCVNGLIRYNKKGEFNNSFHYSRPGIHPDKLDKIIESTSEIIESYEFINEDYKMILNTVTKDDFVYLDPPYFNTRGRYYGTIDYTDFFKFLEDLNKKGIKYALSFDGKSENKNYLFEVPKELYKRHILIRSGKSTFNKVIDGKSNEVHESLYLNW
ncbi:MAG: DNA adenine methylase [Candidatus Delongbacteria bacterium]|nr:DNA adenine methylase [Candidatus Delongbacteria bacterium]